ncbi:MAG TPA: bifunctional [glutamate--ammonia ligase]-adenylyl-L-tyrosine phosphorylase/[glutamate--ammonia-ligase] adenylyltransferase [Candidatus Polarisedimenticolia bacterium]|nr:bifunctional [glutamate--ammonia ligase]-adenylyl-L-tyrosine phosphorylase/[glutamate--ammonia-ligase] adenylyltransferase [Candidatus Polarisedimenticolia bacterium]
MAPSAREEVSALIRRMLEDPARGEADLTRIAPSSGGDSFFRLLARLLPEIPDPDLALVHLERYCREGPLPADPESLDTLLTLLGFSPYLAESIINDRGFLPELIRHRRAGPWGPDEYRGALARWMRIARPEDPWDALRTFKRRTNLRIGLRDLQRRASFVEVSREIAHAADALVEAGLEMVLSSMIERFGRPQAYDAAGRIVEASLAVISLGKLGGMELNYSSDIDLLFLYSGDGVTSGTAGRPGSHIGNKEFFTQAAEALTRGLGHIGPEGQVFRVDCRLRPGGRDGDLVAELESAIVYYRTWARPWERQALIKARACAGDHALAARFLERIEPILYPAEPDPLATQGIREMKDRIDAHLARAGTRERHVKLGRGGIREIEFTAQALQLAHGGREPWVREGNTLLALHRLADKGLLSGAEHGALTGAYVVLREVEHRLQLHRNLQRSTFPEPPREQRVLARSLGYRDSLARAEAAGLRSDLDRHRSAVRLVYDAVLGRLSQVTLQEEAGPDPFLDELPDVTVIALLRAAGIADAASLLGSIKSIARLLASHHVPPEARRAFRHVTPVLVRELAASAAPVRALRTLERFLASFALEPGGLAALFASREIVPPLIRLFAGSQALSSALIHRPGLVLEEGFGAAIAHQPSVQEHLQRLAGESASRDTAGMAAFLRTYQRAQQLYIGLRDLNGQARVPTVQRALSDLAEAILRVCTAAAARACGWETADGDATPGFAVLGLGKMGYREMDYASDLDLVFVYDPGAREIAARHAAAGLLASRVVETLTSITREGALYAVDTRLRPFGTQGELAQPAAQMLSYFRTTAGVWEMQSFLKARPVAGDIALGEQITANLEEAILTRARQEDVGRAVGEMRDRLAREAPGNEGGVDIKLGEGGLGSVQFAVQFLQLRHAIPSPPHKRTARLLASLRSAGVLDEASYRTLFTGFQFLRALEHQVRLSHGRPASRLPASEEAVEEIARACGYARERGLPARSGLLADLARHRQGIEAVFRHVLERSGEAGRPVEGR